MFNDAFAVVPVASIAQMVDMTRALATLRILRQARIPATMTHLVVRACALVLGRHPEWNWMVCNYRLPNPARVDIGLSMVGRAECARIVVLKAVHDKPLSALVPEFIEAIDPVDKERRDLANLPRWTWVVPFSLVRRFVSHALNKWMWFRRRIAATLQVSIPPMADLVPPLLFQTGSLLCVGAVRERPVAIDGRVAVRRTAWLTLTADRGAMDGVRGAGLLRAIQDLLESDELVREAQEARNMWIAQGQPLVAPTAPRGDSART